MTPGKNNEGFTDYEMENHDGSSSSTTAESDLDHVSVTVVGAGPAGLMLAYAYSIWGLWIEIDLE